MDNVITIDGPAGAGKSTASRQLAERLGYEFLDTGAMYRAVALAAIESSLDWADASAISAFLNGLNIDLRGDRVFLNDREVTDEIRTSEVTTQVHYAADHPQVRSYLVELQRAVASGRRVVTEGRDQGTVVFPDAFCKLFLTASASERARRRCEELANRGEQVDFETVLAQQEERDLRDRNRKVGRLIAAADAITFETDGLALDDVVDRLEKLVRACIEEKATN